jgi:hypothetical protein
MPLETKRFAILNEGFVCGHCGANVPPTAQTAPRNHCPFCLWSKHVDRNPGDRANPCRGMLRPIGIYTHSKKEYVILQQCLKCGERVRAKAILRDANAADDFEVILELAGNPIAEKRPVPPHMMSRMKRNRRR